MIAGGEICLRLLWERKLIRIHANRRFRVAARNADVCMYVSLLRWIRMYICMWERSSEQLLLWFEQEPLATSIWGYYKGEPKCERTYVPLGWVLGEFLDAFRRRICGRPGRRRRYLLRGRWLRHPSSGVGARQGKGVCGKRGQSGKTTAISRNFSLRKSSYCSLRILLFINNVIID